MGVNKIRGSTKSKIPNSHGLGDRRTGTRLRTPLLCCSFCQLIIFNWGSDSQNVVIYARVRYSYLDRISGRSRALLSRSRFLNCSSIVPPFRGAAWHQKWVTRSFFWKYDLEGGQKEAPVMASLDRPEGFGQVLHGLISSEADTTTVLTCSRNAQKCRPSLQS